MIFDKQYDIRNNMPSDMKEKEWVYSICTMKEKMIKSAKTVRKLSLKKLNFQQRLEDKKKMRLEDVKKRSEHILRNATIIWEHLNINMESKKRRKNQTYQEHIQDN